MESYNQNTRTVSGIEANYRPYSAHNGLIYFAIDTGKVFFNGKNYSGSAPTEITIVDTVSDLKYNGNILYYVKSTQNIYKAIKSGNNYTFSTLSEEKPIKSITNMDDRELNVFDGKFFKDPKYIKVIMDSDTSFTTTNALNINQYIKYKGVVCRVTGVKDNKIIIDNPLKVKENQTITIELGAIKGETVKILREGNLFAEAGFVI